MNSQSDFPFVVLTTGAVQMTLTAVRHETIGSTVQCGPLHCSRQQWAHDCLEIRY